MKALNVVGTVWVNGKSLAQKYLSANFLVRDAQQYNRVNLLLLFDVTAHT